MADVRVNLAFTADTSKAQAAIQSLQQSLSQLSSASVKGSMSKEMEQASEAAKELQYHLNQAFNAKTGNFDLSRLDKSLKSSGQNIDVLSSKLLGAGQQGQQAFIQLAQSIAAAERPSITLSKRMTDLFTTLKNTAKWQISSSILHGFMGAVQQAYGYAQDLNESLNNIRIVTGYSVDKMAQFAGEANKAAKALSTTTTAYTDASLIYYQQGLSDSEVKERTDVTVKLANVARESATEVSDQMTAVWNNFADGSKSLEYYADVITKLGAATAASNAEIAEGIEKFSAISNTVGLSFEYATSALTTVVDRTRQSADTVGTAFKTMFARIQGLKLGETLEDGTTLNQYSQALQSVGINIKESNGELKDMDVILDEMGAKWKELNRDEQVALAQKVAGVRQYQQLVSLMENYDFFKENVDLARNSEGALQEQADIYAESWEAASKRVKASAEAIYSDLLNDKFFININNALSGLLDSVDAFIDGMGGIAPIITGIGALFLNIFSSKIPSALNSLKANLSVVFQGAAKSASQLTLNMASSSMDQLYSNNNTMNDSMRQALQNTIDLTTAKNKLSAVQKELTSEELQGAQATITYIQQAQQELQVLADKITQRKANIAALKEEVDLNAGMDTMGAQRSSREKQLTTAYNKAEQNYAEDTSGENLKKVNEAQKALQQYKMDTMEAAEALESYTNKLTEAYLEQMKMAEGAELSSSEIIDLSECFTPFIEKIDVLETKGDFKILKQSIIDLESQLTMVAGDTIPGLQEALQAAVRAPNNNTLIPALEKVKKILEEAKISADKLPEALKGVGQGKLVNDVSNQYKGLKKELDELISKQNSLNKKILEFNPQHVRTGLEKITQTAASFGQLYMAISAVKSLFDTWSNEDLSFGEKLTASLMSISMIVPGVIGTLTSLNKIFGLTQIAEMAQAEAAYNTAAAIGFKITVEQSEEALKAAGIASDQIAIIMAKKKTETTLEQLAADDAITASTLAKIAIEKLGLTSDQAIIVVKKLKEGASLREALAEAGVTVAEGASIPVKIAHAAATFMQTVATEGLLAALTPLLPIILAVAAAIAALAVIITGIVIGIKSLIAESHKYSDATKKAEEQVKNFEGQLQSAKQAAEDLKTTISNWDSAVQALSELDKHTEAYAEKLKEANQQAQDLIEKYGLYNDYFIEDGQIKFKEGVLEKIQLETDKRVRALEIDVAAAKIDKNNKSTLEMSNDLSKKMTYQEKTGTYLDHGEEYNTYTTKNVGLGQVQMAADKITDFIKAYNTDPNTGKDLGTSMIPPLEEIKQYLKTNEDIPSAIRDNLDSWGDDLITELVEYSQEKDKNDKNSAFQIDQIRNNVIQDQYDAQLSQMAVDNTGEVDYAKKNTLTELLSIMQKNFDQQNQYDLQRQLEGASQSDARSNKDVGAENDEDLARKYAVKILGVSEEIAEKASYKGGVGKGSLSFKGEEILTNKNDVEMRQELDIQEQKQKVIEDYQNNELSDDLLESLQHISEVGTEYGKKIGADLNSALLESFESGSQKIDLSSIFGELSESEVQELMSSIYSQSPEDFIKQMGISEEELKSLGYDSALDFAQAFAQGLSEWNPDDAAASFKAKLQAATATEAESYDLDPEMVSEVAEAFVEAGKAGDEMYKTLADNAEEAAQVARTYIRVNNAVLDLSEHYEDYAGILKQVQDAHNKQDKAMIANSTSAKKFKTSLAGLLDVSEDFIDADLLDAIDPKDFDAASKGDTKAIENIRSELIKLQADAEGINFEGLKKDIDDLANEDVEVVFGADTTRFLYALLQAKVEAGAGADEINGLLSAFNLTADISDFEASLTEAQAASARAAGAIINEQTYSTDVEAAQVDTDTQAVDYSVDQTVTKKDIPGQVSTWVVSEADGAATPLEYPTTYPQYNKVTTVTPVTSTGTETSAATSQKTTNAAGDQPKNYKGVKIENIRPKGGNTVSQGTRDTANQNRNSCFVAGTLISKMTGFEVIENIKIGDIVLSYNEQTHKNEYSEVLQTMIHITKEPIYKLFIENDVLEVTGIHRFFIKRNKKNQWISAQELTINDEVLFANHTWHKILNIKIDERYETVYNFEVANNHNYYVGKNQILAHNKGGSCFIAGTKVSLGQSFKNIEDIKIGDIVLSYNEQTHHNEYSEVLQTMIHYVNEEIYDLYIEDEVLSVTGIHRFYIKQNNFIQWIAAENLQIGDNVLLANGTWHEIKDIKVSVQLTTVYNFEVANNHNYYVGKNQILAHNKGGSCFEAGTLVFKDNHFEPIENIKIGDIVLSYNEKTKKNEYSKVLQTMIHHVYEKIYSLKIADDLLKVTGIHRFLIERNKKQSWVEAENLQINDKVLFANGTWHPILQIENEIKLDIVYNFEVASNHNYYVGKNQILAHNKGGSSTPAEKKDYTKKSDVVDRYKQINDKLGTVNKNLDKYNKLSDLAYGKNKLKMMNNILNAYKQEIKLQQQLSAEAKKYLPEDKKNLEAAAADLGTSKLKYDNDGNVKNIESIQGEIFVKIHAAEEKYNSFATKEQQDEYNKSTLEPLMKQYEEFKNYLSKYEETKQKIADAEAAELDAQVEYMNQKLEVVGKKRQVKMDFRDTEIKMFSREIEKLENQAFAAGKRIAYLTASMKAMNDQVKIEKTSVKSSILHGIYFLDENGNRKKNKDGTLKTLSDSDKYKNLSLDQLLSKMQDPKFWETHEMNETAAEQLIQALDNLMELDQSLDELKETINHQMADTFDRWAQVMERHMRKMEHFTSRANTWMEIVNEVGKVNLKWDSDQMKKYRQQNWNVNLNKAKADYSQYQTYQAEYQEAKKGYHTAVQDKRNEAAKASKAAEEHDDKADEYKKKAADIRGSQMQKNLNTWRARREEIKEELKNKDLTKEQKEKLKKEDSELKDNINKTKKSDTYKESITYKKQQRDNIKAQIDELEAKDKLTKKEKEHLEQLKSKHKLLKDQIKNLRAQAEEYDNLTQTEKELAEQERNNAKAIESEIETIKSDLYDMEDQVSQSRDQIYEDLLELIQLSKENLSAYLDDVMKDFEAKVSGVYGSIENMQTAFEQNKQVSERYLQDTEKIYELTKLNRDITKKMDESQNVKAKEKLKKLQEDIVKYAAQGVKMSEYDLQIMQKQYDLEVAKIAMEEAQNAKTQVRLTRDAEGNYSYTYTADESKQAEAEQTYEDKLNDIIKYNNDYQLQMQEMILNTEKAEEDAINRLREQYENSEITLDQFYAQAEQAHAFYKSQMQYYAQENEKASENSVYFFATEYDAYYSNSDKKIKVNRTFSDDTRKTYEEVHQVYKDAAINRDKALYDSEVAYRESYNKKAAELKEAVASGKKTQEQADKELAALARQHSNELDKINEQYTTDLQKEVTLQNGTKKAASDYFQKLVTGDGKKNKEIIDGMKLDNKGFIINTETEFLPGLGTTYGKATDTVKKFADAVSNGKGDNDTSTLLGQMKKGMQDHEANVKSAEEAIGIVLGKEGDAFKTLSKEANTNMTSMVNQSKKLANQVDADGKKAIEDMNLTVESVKNWYKKNKKWLKKTKNSIDSVTTAIKNMIAAANNVKPTKVTVDTKDAEKNLKNLKKAYEDLLAAQKKTPPTTPTTPTAPTTPTTPTTPTLTIDSTVKLKSGTYLATSAGGKQNVHPASWVTDGSTKLYIQATRGEWVHLGTTKTGFANEDTYVGWVKKTDLKGFDTGGYTGKWGVDGRLAMLHQKELVLNAKDTENMLAAVKTVREIAAMVDLQAQNASLAGQYALAIGQLTNARNAQSLDQNVHITAEFPNVQDHNEIEMALTSLVNRASQYAWRN